MDTSIISSSLCSQARITFMAGMGCNSCTDETRGVSYWGCYLTTLRPYCRHEPTLDSANPAKKVGQIRPWQTPSCDHCAHFEPTESGAAETLTRAEMAAKLRRWRRGHVTFVVIRCTGNLFWEEKHCFFFRLFDAATFEIQGSRAQPNQCSLCWKEGSEGKAFDVYFDGFGFLTKWLCVLTTYSSQPCICRETREVSSVLPQP